MKLSYFPQIKVVHTSKVFHGQVYVPMLNWLMMVGTILIAAIYQNTTSLGNAYGVCVIFVTFFDTCMVSLAAILVWRFHPLLVFFPWLIFALLDCTFLSSALTKVPDGAWFTLTLSAVLAALFILWRFGKESQWAAEAEERFTLSTLLKKHNDGTVQLTDRFGGGDLSPIRGFGIFFDKSGEKTPHVFTQFLSKLVAIPECMIFFHLRPLETPSVPVDDRFTVSRLGIPGCYRLVVRHGYMDEVITLNLASLIFEQIRDFLIRQGDDVSDKRISEEQEEQPKKAKVNVAAKSANDSPDTSDINENNSDTITTQAATTTATDASNTNHRSEPFHATLSPRKNTIRARSPGASTQASQDSRSRMLDEKDTSELRRVEHAFNTQSLYIIGKESLKVKPGSGIFRKGLLEFWLFLRENTRTKIANLRVPTEKVVEVGFVKEM